MDNRLTIVINSLEGGGAEKVSLTLANQLANRGYLIDFVVLNLKKSVHHQALDRRVRLINLDVGHARTSFLAFRRYLQGTGPEKILVFNHELAVVLVILRFLMRNSFKLIARTINTLSEIKKYESSFWNKYMKDMLVKCLYNWVDHLIAQSEMMRDDLVQNYRIPPDKITIINNPVSAEFEAEEKKQNGVIPKRNEVLFVGRLEKQKGLTYLIDAFRRVLHTEPDLKLRILGSGSLQDELTASVRSAGIADSVLFEGFQKDIIPYYKRAKVTVLSSLFEGFPNVLVESIFAGTPVVAFDCKSGPREIIEEGINGFLANYLDVGHLAEMIGKALHTDWDIEKIRQSAEKYRPAQMVEKYIAIIGN